MAFISQLGPLSDSDDSHKGFGLALNHFSLKQKLALLLPHIDLKAFSWENVSSESDLD